MMLLRRSLVLSSLLVIRVAFDGSSRRFEMPQDSLREGPCCG